MSEASKGGRAKRSSSIVSRQQNSKKPKDSEQTYKNPGIRLMEKMGWQFGKGLGRKLHGRLRPVETAPIGLEGKREGFGLRKTNYEMASEPDKRTNVTWLKNRHRSMPDQARVHEWESHRFIDEFNDGLIGTVFCDDKRLVTDAMALVAALKKTRFADAKRDWNDRYPADVKMGNIDIVYEHMFTYPAAATVGDQILYFADISNESHRLCDYMLIKMKGLVRGYGFVTRDARTMEYDAYRENFHVFSTYHGDDHVGNLCNLKSQRPFRNTIMSETSGRGVYVITCAGEDQRKGQDYNDEMSTRQLYVCQLYLALRVLCDGGNFVMRVGSLYSIFSASLVYLIYRCFDRISIFKPATSDPTDSERFVIGEGKRPDTELIANYLDRVNDAILSRGSCRDLLSLVEFSDLVEDAEFCEYLKLSNEIMGAKQVHRMRKMVAYYKRREVPGNTTAKDDDSDVEIVFEKK